MVYRIYVEKRPGLSPEAGSLLGDLQNFLGLTALSDLRVLNRYDVEGICRGSLTSGRTPAPSASSSWLAWSGPWWPAPRSTSWRGI